MGNVNFKGEASRKSKNLDQEEQREPPQIFIDQSTPSLENVYNNYRELRVQSTSRLKRFIGTTLIILVTAGLILLHVILMASLTES